MFQAETLMMQKEQNPNKMDRSTILEEVRLNIVSCYKESRQDATQSKFQGRECQKEPQTSDLEQNKDLKCEKDFVSQRLGS